MKSFLTVLLTIVLTMQLGRIQFEGHDETYYSLPMDPVIAQARQKGYNEEVWVRADRCWMYSKYVMVAASYKKHPYGSTVRTSLGEGIVLDTGDFAKKEPYTIDIATTW